MTIDEKRVRAKEGATLLEARLAHEFNLTGHRMTWLVTSQSFLFAAWAQLLKQPGQVAMTDQLLLGWLIPVIGFVTAFAGGIAVSAAMRMTDYLITDRAHYDDLLGLRPMSPLRPSQWSRMAGHVPPGILPPLFAFSWVAVFLRGHFANTVLSNESLLANVGGLWGLYVALWALVIVRRHRAACMEAAQHAKASWVGSDPPAVISKSEVEQADPPSETGGSSSQQG